MDERILCPVSDLELERRWALCRQAMAERDIDAIVTQNTNDWLGGYVKWLSDIPANNGYPRSVIFYRDRPMTIVEMGATNAVKQLAGQDRVHRGVERILHTPSFPSIHYTAQDDAALVADDLMASGAKSIAFIARDYLPSAFVTRIERQCEGVRVVDFTEEADRFKAVKSPTEIALIAQTALLQDQVFSAVLDVIKPGMRDIDVTAFAQAAGQRLGSEQGIFLGASAPIGIRSSFLGRHHQGRVIERGDHLSILIEINGPSGFYTELARTIVLGKASPQLKTAFAAVCEAQAHTLSLMKPGVLARDIHAAHNRYMTARGLPPELRLYAHGQGYDMVERPLIRQDETMALAEGMCLAVHPGFETDELFAVVCDNYMIETSGAGPCLHKTGKMIFEIS